MRYFCDHDDPRLLSMAKAAEEDGGVLKVKLDDLMVRLDMPRQAIMRRAKWGELYGLWLIKKGSGPFGSGRTPNEYHLLMSVDEWMERGPKIVDDVHRQLYTRRAKAQAQRPRKMPKPQVKARVDETWKRIQEQAKREVTEAIKNGGGLPPVKLPRISETELNEWAAMAEATEE